MSLRFLPLLNPELQPPAPNAGADFGVHGGGPTVLLKYSSALVVSHTDVPTERLKSVPSPWARLLLFEQALFAERHPAHARIVSEWRGLMGSIGLAHYLGITMDVTPIDLARSNGAIRNLRALAPRDQRQELWDRFALIRLDGELVGGTSPRTLVFTTIRTGRTGRAPFQRNGRLFDPAEHYKQVKDVDALALLLEWLTSTESELESASADLHAMLGNLSGGQGDEPIARSELILAQFRRWKVDAESALAGLGATNRVAGGFAESRLAAAFPSRHSAALVYSRLRHVVAAPGIGERNDLTVLGTTAVANPGSRGLLTRDGQPFSGDVILPHGMTRQVEDGRFSIPTSAADVGATWTDLSTAFEAKLVPVTGVNSAAARGLQIGAVTYLIPLKPEILNTVPADQLGAWVSARGDPATEVVVTLALPLRSGLVMEYRQVYAAVDIVRGEQVTTPLITEWPDFQSEAWEHYFYFVRQPTRRGASLIFEPHMDGTDQSFSDDSAGVRWGKTTSPAAVWVGRYGRIAGLLLSGGRPQVRVRDDEWAIAIDFGSTHTRIFRSAPNALGGIDTREVELRPRVRPVLGTDNQLEFNFFGGQNAKIDNLAEAPSLIWMPLGRAVRQEQGNGWLPSDGVVYWGGLRQAPTEDGLRGNLKWHRDEPEERAAFHSYISQIYLAVAAEAASEGARVKSLITAYPSVLPIELRHRHRQEWKEIERDYRTHVAQPRSESDAVASYFVQRQGAAISTNLLALDVGGSTCDLAVWSKGRQVFGDSIRLAGDILTRLVAEDSSARDAISIAVSRPPFNLSGVAWDATHAARNGFIFNSLLRELWRNPEFRAEPDLLARNLNGGSGSPGERLIAHLAYLFGCASFVIGMMARRAGLKTDRFDVRFAGKGAQYLYWLEALSTGASTRLPTSFFRAGAGISDATVQVTPPADEAKQEVGRGLLAPAVGSAEGPDDRVTFIGETCFATSEGDLAWSDELTFEKLRRIEPPSTPKPLTSFERLSEFVNVFETDAGARKAAVALGLIPRALDGSARDAIHDALYGPKSVWHALQKGASAGDRMLLEPFFVVEAKRLLEHVTKNHGLFD